MKRLLSILLLLPPLLPVRGQEADQMALSQIFKTYQAIQYLYVDSVNSTQLAEAAIRGMMEKLDPHSEYLTPEQFKALNESLGGNFDGIGIRYQMSNDTLIVINTVAGGPSAKVGISSGDRILRADGEAISGVKMNNNEVQKRLRGPKGTSVHLDVQRGREMIAFDVIRDKIPVQSVNAAYMAAPGIGYIKVDRFAQTTPMEFATALDSLTQLGMNDLITDLRDNGGGLLTAAVELANFFIPADRTIVYTQGRTQNKEIYRTWASKKFPGRLVVLVDEESASASEIFTGAVQDYDRGIVVGRRTFGKGLVQRQVTLPGDAMLKLTVSHYYTPSGRCIQKPYKKGNKKDYYKDLVERYNKGEYFSMDSIHFPDSLKYKTEGGRTVYGGGGIMPDIFVPLDTTLVNRTHRDIIARGTLNRFVLRYFADHQRRLRKQYPEFRDFNHGFSVSPEMLAELHDKALSDSVRLDSAEWVACQPLLSTQLKAQIAADLYTDSAFSEIMNLTNQIYLRALDLLLKEDEYLEILRPAPHSGKAAS